jgi:hypothetical protein
MARRMREYPWAGSPLGEPRDWPASLRTAVRICLTSRFPIIVWWGEDLRFLYNDAYLPLLGNKHPALMQPGHHRAGGKFRDALSQAAADSDVTSVRDA